MYNYNQAKKNQINLKRKQCLSFREQRRLQHYNQQVKPRLLQHYDARVNAFIKQIEESPRDQSKIIKKHASANLIPFKFTIKQSRAGSGINLKNSMIAEKEPQSIWRASDYKPLSRYQFRQRDKDKEIPPKLNPKSLMYRRWKHERQQILQKQAKKRELKTQQSKITNSNHLQTLYSIKQIEDNRSDIPSISEGNISLRYSVNSQLENIQREAREYQKNQEIVEKKTHFKRLANLQQVITDPKAKQSIRNLLIKEGKTRPKAQILGQEDETDLLKQYIQKGQRLDTL